MRHRRPISNKVIIIIIITIFLNNNNSEKELCKPHPFQVQNQFDLISSPSHNYTNIPDHSAA